MEKQSNNYNTDMQLKNHEGRIRTLERETKEVKGNFSELNKRVNDMNNDIQDRFMRMENMMMSENRELRTTLTNTVANTITEQLSMIKKDKDREHREKESRRKYREGILSNGLKNGWVIFIFLVFFIQWLFGIDLSDIIDLLSTFGQ